MQAKIIINTDDNTFTHSKGAWSGIFPIADLQRWLSFYRTQRVRYPARMAIYEADIRVLPTALDQMGDGVLSAGSRP